MALIWKKQLSGKRYEVRGAGNTIRLYTNGVFHSQFNPNRILSGNLWDLLVLPALFAPTTIRRVLVLGVGGGAVIQQLRHLIHPDIIVGIDEDPVHLDVARRFFRLHGPGIRLHLSEARQWLQNYRGQPFDMVIEDLLTDQDRQPVRAIRADASWFRLLLRHMTPTGIAVFNFDCRRTLRQSAYCQSPEISRRFASAFHLTTPQNHNVVAAFLRKAADAHSWLENLAETPFRTLVNVRPQLLC